MYWTRSDDALPIASGAQTSLPADLVSRVRKLVQEEQAGARELRALATRERDIDGGLHSLLLEAMALDSDKHARLLQFVVQHVARRARPDG